MIGYIYMALAIFCFGFAWAAGRASERVAASTIMYGTLATIAVQRITGDHFANVLIAQVAVDVSVFLIFYILAMRGSRTWVLWIAAWQLVNLMTHLARSLDHGMIEARVYSMSQGFWAYPTIGLVIYATWKGRRFDKCPQPLS
ncbi:hypothetical protein [Flavisphingopyxis soli]|uniref:hypothetical protein n=1 Tax=Flavisphingopyxis soli TaxID=2601267 RepID=UPI001F460C21|nr:hypothetical protein [Sphingorhabdus soli]